MIRVCSGETVPPPSQPSNRFPPPQVAKSWNRRIVFLIVVALLGSFAFWMWRSIERSRERQRGLEFAAKGDFKSGEPLLLKSLERDATDVEVIKVLATTYARANDEGSASPFLEQWEKARPGDIEPIATRFRMKIRLRHYEEAIADAERLASRADMDSDLHLHVADVFWRAGRLPEAERASRAGRAALPGDASLRLQLAEILHAKTEYPAAREILDELLRDAPELARAWKISGIVAMDQGNPASAIPHFEKALSLDSSDVNARYYLALALIRSGKEEPGRREMDRYERTRHALDLANLSFNYPEKLDLAIRAAGLLFEAGLDTQARLFVNQVLERDPNHAAAIRLRDARIKSSHK